MFAAASTLFGKSSSLAAYTLHATSNGVSPASSSTSLPSLSSPSHAKVLTIGLWKVLGATHKTTGKDVSVWIFEKRVLDGVRGESRGMTAASSKAFVLEQLKREATSLSRLRHPDILHMVEPLEETRSELTFVTETITASLGTLLSAASKKSRRTRGLPPGEESTEKVDLDEVEIQKGTLQLAKGLAFLHQQAKMVHLNLSPDAVLINSKGDWKLSGLDLITPMVEPDGRPTKYVYPEFDPRLPPQIQWKYDYLAPEYALDSMLTPANDLYSLGCVLYAVHMGGSPPFKNRQSMQTLRDNAEGSLVRRDWMSGSRWDRCSTELKDLLPRLITRNPSTRISLASLPSHSFFSSLAISALNFLDATTFASKPREEKATFLRGLVRVLPTFSDRLRRRKILPSLLEEMKDSYLLPFILPNVFEISKTLSKEEFTVVLPKLQPLFALKDPPQNMLTLLEHMSLFEEKTIPAIFRENVMPLVYNSLESEHQAVQEKVLQSIPHLCDILDYGTVQNVLLVKVAILFTRTRILSVKVQTLECFKAMVAILDKATLTTKLVPLLAKIKTKEPAVMMATLNVHEAMGAKVDREAIAILVLPQLWAMSMGPLLNADQFAKFMAVIKSLGNRVEQEHTRHLRDVGRIEKQTASFGNSLSNGSGLDFTGGDGEVDFEALVKGNSSASNPLAMPAASTIDPWDMDSWATADNSTASITFPSLTISADSTPGPSLAPSPAPHTQGTRPAHSGSSKLKARPVPSSTFNSSAFTSPPLTPSASGPPKPPAQTFAVTPSVFGSMTTTTSFAPLQPTQSSLASLTPQQPTTKPAPLAPNYNVSLTPQQPFAPKPAPAPSLSFSQPTPAPAQPAQPLQPAVIPPPGWSSGLMQPTTAPKSTWGTSGKASNQGWDDFDPLK